MKRIITFLLLFAALKVAGQTTGYLRFDTVRIMKQNGTCELYIINKTKDSLGLLTNVGGGLTQFKRSRMLNDSTLIIGMDTLVVHSTGGGGSPGAPDKSVQFRTNSTTFGGNANFTYDSAVNIYSKARYSSGNTPALKSFGLVNHLQDTSQNYQIDNLKSYDSRWNNWYHYTSLIPNASGGTISPSDNFVWSRGYNISNHGPLDLAEFSWSENLELNFPTASDSTSYCEWYLTHVPVKTGSPSTLTDRRFLFYRFSNGKGLGASKYASEVFGSSQTKRFWYEWQDSASIGAFNYFDISTSGLVMTGNRFQNIPSISINTLTNPNHSVPDGLFMYRGDNILSAGSDYYKKIIIGSGVNKKLATGAREFIGSQDGSEPFYISAGSGVQIGTPTGGSTLYVPNGLVFGTIDTLGVAPSTNIGFNVVDYLNGQHNGGYKTMSTQVKGVTYQIPLSDYNLINTTPAQIMATGVTGDRPSGQAAFGLNRLNLDSAFGTIGHEEISRDGGTTWYTQPYMNDIYPKVDSIKRKVASDSVFYYNKYGAHFAFKDSVGSGGGGVSDGDKGDITISGSGATYTIDNDVVTFAKLQNIATNKLLGRSTASSGDVEEISIGSGLTLSSGTLSASSSSVAGSNTQIQYKGSGSFAASSNFVWDNTNHRVGIGQSTPLDNIHIDDAAPAIRLVNNNDNSSTRFLGLTGDEFGISRSAGWIFFANSSGFIGTGGITSPTAWLHLPAATTAAASLRIPTGTAPTSPNEGDMWRASNLVKTYNGSATRRFVVTDDNTASNGKIPIGNGTDFTVANITSTGGTVTVTNTAGGINLDIPTTVSSSANYTPTLTNGTNVGSSSLSRAHYYRQGSHVIVYLLITIDPTSTGTTNLDIELPFASDIGASAYVLGLGNCTLIPAQTGTVGGNGIDERATFQFIATDLNAQAFYITFSYEIL